MITNRRGAALLFTLAAVTIIVTACAALARLSVASSLNKSLSYKQSICRDLLTVADAPIEAWLERDSHAVVLAPDATEPRVEVLHDLIHLDGVTLELHITAWDQFGMAPLSLTKRGSLLRGTLPEQIIRSVDSRRSTPGGPLGLSPGLDLFDRSNPYPQSPTTEPRVFGPTRDRASYGSGKDRSAPALGALVATHNPSPLERGSRTRTSTPGAINVNTAPMPLIEAAMRMAGRRGIELIRDARERGEPAPALGEPVAEPLPNAPRLVAASEAWSFRIDVAADTVKRSWWAVYTREQGGWRCVQRLTITQ
ncbi:MAG: hypothetical protein IH985_09995 [Planctomycetes bacterium]|nr:hypothetical protein [Planctomycetota bacterium]